MTSLTSAKLEHELFSRFGFSHFRDGQFEVISALLAGESVAAVFPTGSGKSLCYQLPATLLPGVALVVSPLLALMKDQVDALTARGVAAARLDSSLSAEQYGEVLQQARAGKLDLLYVAPERFQNERFRGALSGLRVSLFAVDEAHCVSEWGHNFRPDYLKLASYAKDCGAERILALTATATPKVLDDISETFELDRAVRTSFHRPNLILGSKAISSVEDKWRHLTACLDSPQRGPTIVYVTLQKTAMEVAGRLQSLGYSARPYHAGLDSELRAETQDWFLTTTEGVVVATIAFGMGIDKADIRAIVHFDPPKSLENYAQEIGRAGRDGRESWCTVLYHPPDRIPLENFVYGDTPTRQAILTLLAELFSGPTELLVNLNALSTTHDIRPLVLRTLLTYLELDGWLRALTPVYSTYRFKPQKSSAEILGHYQGQEQHFLAQVFRRSQKKKIWFTIDLEETAAQLNCQRERVVGALDRCAEDGFLELSASDLRYRYFVERSPSGRTELEELAGELFRRAQNRERGELQRLGQAIDLVLSESCQPGVLSAHFGERLQEPCGRCSACLGEPRKAADSAPAEWTIPPLPAELQEPRNAARFLCGVSSPHLVKGRLTKSPLFGSLTGVPFAEVLRALEKA